MQPIDTFPSGRSQLLHTFPPTNNLTFIYGLGATFPPLSPPQRKEWENLQQNSSYKVRTTALHLFLHRFYSKNIYFDQPNIPQILGYIFYQVCAVWELFIIGYWLGDGFNLKKKISNEDFHTFYGRRRGAFILKLKWFFKCKLPYFSLVETFPNI